MQSIPTQAGIGVLGCERGFTLKLFFDFAIFHFDFFDFRFFKFRFSFSSLMIIQYYWWIIECNQYNTMQAGAGVLGCEQGGTGVIGCER